MFSLFSESPGRTKNSSTATCFLFGIFRFDRARAREAFAQLVLELVRLVVENISLPEEVEKAIDARSQMNVVGDLNSYTQFQTATAIGKSGDRPGGSGLDGAGLGVGLGLGAAVAQTMAGAFQPKRDSARSSGPGRCGSDHCVPRLRQYGCGSRQILSRMRKGDASRLSGVRQTGRNREVLSGVRSQSRTVTAAREDLISVLDKPCELSL